MNHQMMKDGNRKPITEREAEKITTKQKRAGEIDRHADGEIKEKRERKMKDFS